MTTVTEAPPLSAVPTFEPFDDGAEFHCIEPGCGKPLTYGGRGRHPKYCEDHKPRRANAGTGSRTRAQRPSVALLGDAVTMNLRTIGSIISLLNQYDGQVVMAGAPVFGNACSNVAEHDPRFRRWLEGSATGIVYGELIAAALIIALPIAANHGIVPEYVMQNVGNMYASMNATVGATDGSGAVPNG